VSQAPAGPADDGGAATRLRFAASGLELPAGRETALAVDCRTLLEMIRALRAFPLPGRPGEVEGWR
jgi:hypothetical protein